MKLLNIKDQTVTIELAYYDCFRLARLLETPSTNDNSLDIEFSEVYASLFAAAGMAAQLDADAPIAHGPRSLESMRKSDAPDDDLRSTAD